MVEMRGACQEVGSSFRFSKSRNLQDVYPPIELFPPCRLVLYPVPVNPQRVDLWTSSAL